MTQKRTGCRPTNGVNTTRPYDAEALRLVNESHRTQAVARQLSTNTKLLYRWQQAQLVAG